MSQSPSADIYTNTVTVNNTNSGNVVLSRVFDTNFPENINIGTIEKVYVDNQTNFFTLDIKLFNDMTSIGYVYIIKSKDAPEIKKLEQETEANEQ